MSTLMAPILSPILAPPKPPEVEYRMVPGLPGYYLGSDRSVWTTKATGRRPRRYASGPRWHRKAADATNRNSVWLWHEGRSCRLNIASTFARVFPELAASCN